MSDREKSVLQRVRHSTPPLQKALRFFSSRSLDKNYAESALRQEWQLCVTREVTVAIKSNYIISEYPHYIIGGARVVQWWSTRLPPILPVFKSRRRRHMWVKFCCWFSPLLREVFSPGTPVFPSPQKPTFSNYYSTRNQVDEEPLSGCATCKSSFIIIYLIIIIRPPVVAIRSAKLSPSFLSARSWTGPNTLSMAILGQRRQSLR